MVVVCTLLTENTLGCLFWLVFAGFVTTSVFYTGRLERFEHGSLRTGQRAFGLFRIVGAIVVSVEIQFRYFARTFRYNIKYERLHSGIILLARLFLVIFQLKRTPIQNKNISFSLQTATTVQLTLDSSIQN